MGKLNLIKNLNFHILLFIVSHYLATRQAASIDFAKLWLKVTNFRGRSAREMLKWKLIEG
jgi:hypothetical protein